MPAPYPPPPHVDSIVRRVAARICYDRGDWPFNLEPGDGYGVDAILPNDDPAHEHWRRDVETAEKIVALVRASL